MQITTIELDLAENVFQVHGIESEGKAVIRRALRRKEVLEFFEKLDPCLVGIARGVSNVVAMVECLVSAPRLDEPLLDLVLILLAPLVTTMNNLRQRI